MTPHIFADSWVGEEIPNQKCREMFSEALDKVKKVFEGAGVNVRAELLACGDPGKVIASYVEEKGVDKVVMGSRGLNPYKGMVLAA